MCLSERAKFLSSTLVLAALPAILIGPDPVFAQSVEEGETDSLPLIGTDRPTDSVAPVVVPKGTFQLEMGYKYRRFDNADDTDFHEFPDLLVRYGINPKWEARFFTTGFTYRDQPSGSETGFNDISVGAKYRFADEAGRRPQMALLLDLLVPVGHEEFTSNYVVPKVLFVAGHTLSERLGLTYNIGPSLVSSKNNDDRNTDVDLNYAVALSGATGGPATLFGEIYGAFAFGSGRPDRHNVQAGATILLNSRFQIDFRGGLGLVDNEPDWLLGAGLAFRLPG